MIDRRTIMEAARYTDATLGEHGDDIERFVVAEEVELAGLVYAAEQRAVRMAMILDGKDPRRMSQTHFTRVLLSPRAQAMIPTLAATWMDAFMAGRRATQIERNVG